jgi:sugar (pentulose or hexulose) kinase
MDTRYLPVNRFMLVGAGLAGGDAYAWANRAVASWLADLGTELPSEEIYERMNAAAALIDDGSEGLACRPLFRGSRREPLARGQFTGITFDNFTLGHVARAVLEGIAGTMRTFFDDAGEARPEHLQRIVGSGNGLRNNWLLVEILSHTFDREVWLPQHQEEAAFGAALLAGTHCGLWPDLDSAGRSIQLTRAAVPR